MFGFQRLDVYRCAITFLGVSAQLSSRTPRGYGGLADPLRRAALSVPLNVAEGSGKSPREAARYYSIARGSALECAAVLDAFEALGVAEPANLLDARTLLERIVSMLTARRQA